MKYLAYFLPSEELSSKINKYKRTETSTIGIHTTLYLFHADEKEERKIIKDLEKIRFKNFDVITTSLDNFGEDITVLRLSKPKELQILHEGIIRTCNPYSFGEQSPYFGENYNPHISLSKNSNRENTIFEDLLGISYSLHSFNLAKKSEGIFKKVAEFQSIR